jgi:hypothetical protein
MLRFPAFAHRSAGRFPARLCLLLGFFLSLFVGLFFAGHAARAQEDAAPLRAAAEAFRITTGASYLKALEAYSTPQANLKFAALSDLIWPTANPVVAWRAFMSAALVNMAAIDEPEKIVGFYHPWSDTMLVAKWAKQAADGSLRIVDFSMATGQALRGEPLPYKTAPAWQARGGYPPESVGLVTAETAKAFEADAVAHWPKTSVLRDTPDAEAQAIAASLLVRGGLAGLAPIYTLLQSDDAAASGGSFMDRLSAAFTATDDARAAEMRDLWLSVSHAMERSETPDALLPFAETLALLRKLPERFRQTFFPVGYLPGDTRSMLILTTPYNPDLTIAMQVAHGDTPAITHLDLYSFQSFYDLADTLEVKP